VLAHGFDHVEKVRDYAVKISQAEGTDVFLCEMAGLLHDIGRTAEKSLDFVHAHQEISYQMCRKWFRIDKIFKRISSADKKNILYSVRYHWNDAADKYKTAIILRDADKLDTLGPRGARRTRELFKEMGEDRIIDALRLVFAHYFWLRTKTARKIARDKKLFTPILAIYRKLLKKKISPVKL
jgi:putative nucleotidyltransferase with HDIG domain